MVPKCPGCGGRNLRYAHLRSPSEKIARLAGIRPLRCRDCRQRFVHRTWHLSNLSQARCPTCMGAELTCWSPNHYHVSFGKGLLLFLGAHPYRCERCRCNFVSFRKRKRKRVSRRRHGADSTPSTADGSETVGARTDPHED
jgi:hypothetical protein